MKKEKLGISFPPPTVLNISNVEKKNQYRVDPDTFTDQRGKVGLSLVCFPIDPAVKIEDLPYDWPVLLKDFEKCSGVSWYAEKKGGFVALKTQNAVKVFVLDTDHTLTGENVSKI